MKKGLLIIACSLIIAVTAAAAHSSEEKWPGVDDTVVGKYAEEHGRPARPNLIELEGDSLLFAFLVAGAAGGFVMGYYYREFRSGKGAAGNNDAC